MLQNIRDNTKGIMAKIIIAVICIPFALFGVESLLGGSGSTHVAEVNGEDISAQELNEAIFLQKRKLIAEMGDELDSNQLLDENLREPALQSLIEAKVILQEAQDNNMGISDKQLVQLIVETPEFQEDGKFSKELFQMRLGQMGLSPALYKKFLSRELLIGQVNDAVTKSGFFTEKDLEIISTLVHEKRDVRYLNLKLSNFLENVEVSEDEAMAYYQQYPEQFQSDESAIVNYIEIRQSDFAPEITEDAIRAQYEQELNAFEVTETRSISHILVEISDERNEEEANKLISEIQARLDQGESFAELAKTYSDDFGSRDLGGELGILNEEAFSEPFVNAARLLKEDEVSPVVETDYGLHLIKLTALEQNTPPSLEERKDAIRKELALAQAQPAYFETLEELKNITFNTLDLTEAANQLDLKIKQSGKITRQGGDGIFNRQKLIKPIFSENLLVNKENSEVIEITSEYAVVMHIKEHFPPALKPFEEVSQQAMDIVKREKAIAELDQMAGELLEALKKGAEVDALAKQYKLDWQVLLQTERSAQNDKMALLDAAFALPAPGEGFRGIDKVVSPSGDMFVFTVENVTPGEKADFTAMEKSAFTGYIARVKSMEKYQALQKSLKKSADVEIFNRQLN